MYIAMNRFKIVRGCERDFEAVWRDRTTFLDKVKGFKKFNLVRGVSEIDFTLYASHSTWESRKTFENWLRSESFRSAHKNAGENRWMYIGHPIFEGFEVVI